MTCTIDGPISSPKCIPPSTKLPPTHPAHSRDRRRRLPIERAYALLHQLCVFLRESQADAFAALHELFSALFDTCFLRIPVSITAHKRMGEKTGMGGGTSRGERAFEEKSVTQVSKQSAVTLKNIFIISLACFLPITTSSRDCSEGLRSIAAVRRWRWAEVQFGERNDFDKRKVRKIGEFVTEPSNRAIFPASTLLGNSRFIDVFRTPAR
jgi:hypothetical protein